MARRDALLLCKAQHCFAGDVLQLALCSCPLEQLTTTDCGYFYNFPILTELNRFASFLLYFLGQWDEILCSDNVTLLVLLSHQLSITVLSNLLFLIFYPGCYVFSAYGYIHYSIDKM